MWGIKNIKTGNISACQDEPVWILGIWECGDFRITDPNRTNWETVAPTAELVTRVTRLGFKALFIGTERVAIKKARAIDDLVEDFFSMVEDPDATGVDLTLQSTQDALLHLENLEILTGERRLQILAGTPQ